MGWYTTPQAIIPCVCALCCRSLARPRTRHRCSRCLLSLVMSWCKRYGWLRRPTRSECDAAGWGGLSGALTNSTLPTKHARA